LLLPENKKAICRFEENNIKTKKVKDISLFDPNTKNAISHISSLNLQGEDCVIVYGANCNNLPFHQIYYLVKKKIIVLSWDGGFFIFEKIN
jgi:hypothetical protein